MKRQCLLAALSFLLLPVQALADIRLPGGANYQILGRGITWAAGVNQNWILDVVSPSSGMCVNVRNRDTSSHSYTITPVITSDLSVTTFTGNTGAWTSTTIAPTGVNTTLASATDNFFVNTAGAAHVVISISGGSGTGTADITIAQTPNQCGSGGIGSLFQAVSCNQSATQTVSAVSNVAMSTVPPAGQFVHVCAVAVSANGTTAVVAFATGTAGTCVATGASRWGVIVNSNVAPGTGSGIGQIFATNTAAQALCAVVTGTFTTIIIDVSYTVF